MGTCLHTYLYWDSMVPRCAVCKEIFDYEYDEKFIGVFPRDKLEDYVHMKKYVPYVVASTFTTSNMTASVFPVENLVIE